MTPIYLTKITQSFVSFVADPFQTEKNGAPEASGL